MQKLIGFIKKNAQVLYLMASITVGIVVIALNTSKYAGNPQNSLSILMANDIKDGNFMLMRPGQPSVGSIEQYLDAFFAVFFSYSTLTVLLPQIILFVATVFVLWKFFKHTHHLHEMRIVASLLWVSLLVSIFYSNVIYGSMMTAVFLVSVSLVLGYYSAHSLRNKRYFYAWAFVSGLALWASIFSLIFIIPMTIWILYNSRLLLHKSFQAVVFFVFGSLPWWIFNTTNSFASIRTIRSFNAQPIPVSDKDRGFDLFRSLGISPSLTDSLPNALAYLLSVLAFGALVIIVWFSYSTIANFMKEKQKFNAFAGVAIVMLVFALVVEIGFLFLSREIVTAGFAPLILLVFFLCAYKKSWLQNVLLLLAVLVLSIVSTMNAVEPKPVPQKLKEAVRQYDNVLAPYDYAYSLEVTTEGQVSLSPFDAGFYDQDRHTGVIADLDALVMRANNSFDQNYMLCIQGVLSRGFEREEIGEFYIYSVPENAKSEISKLVLGCRVTTQKHLSN